MIAIKAGGSVITRKGARPVFDRTAARRLARTLARLREPFVLVHGTGSFGKPPARRYGYLSGNIPPSGVPVAAIKTGLLRLHYLFLAELIEAGVRAVSCPGCAHFSLRRGRPVLNAPAALRRWCRAGFSPVINSDIFPSGAGFRVVSSDALLGAVCAALRPSLAGFLTDVPVVLDAAGRPVREAGHSAAAGLARAVPADRRDVSGGMRAKLAEAAAIAAAGTGVLLLDGRAPQALAMTPAVRRSKGTYIHAAK
ncbi:MAG: hypothetical protein HY952_08650 [Elusimicrobia bacterium]|nr:hypothetical protein [Elusimicrobiota bacterium]